MANDLLAGLTDKQAAYVRARVAGLSQDAAASAAGYLGGAGGGIEALPHIRAAIEEGVRTWLQTEAGPNALRLLNRMVMEEGKWAESTRREAAKFLSDRAGYVIATKNESQQDRRDPQQMTTAELLASVQTLERELADRAKPVNAAPSPTDGAPDSPAVPPQLSDMF